MSGLFSLGVERSTRNAEVTGSIPVIGCFCPHTLAQFFSHIYLFHHYNYVFMEFYFPRHIQMQLYAVKPKLQQVEENLQISQSEYANQQHGVNKYRMKPNQFQKEKVCLFNIPAQDGPYRIIGTKIGVVTDKPINAGEYDPDTTKELFIAVQLAIDVLKRGSKGNERTEEFRYDCLEISDAEVAYLSHKQQLQILNELTTLRKELRNLMDHKDRWVEVITTDVVQ